MISYHTIRHDVVRPDTGGDARYACCVLCRKSIARLFAFYAGAVEDTGDALAQEIEPVQPAEARNRTRILKASQTQGRGGGGGAGEGGVAGGGGGDEWGRFNRAHVWEFVGGCDDAGRGDGVLEVDALADAIFVRGEDCLFCFCVWSRQSVLCVADVVYRRCCVS